MPLLSKLEQYPLVVESPWLPLSRKGGKHIEAWLPGIPQSQILAYWEKGEKIKHGAYEFSITSPALSAKMNQNFL
jgi:hypothetical protein